MAKKVVAVIKLALDAGKANPAPPVGPALGQHGVNIMMFCKEYNARTQDKAGYVIPVEISVFEDRDLHWNHITGFVLRPSVVLLAEHHDVHTVLTEGRAHRRRGVGFAGI